MAEQTFIGAAALLQASDVEPAELRRRVTSPKGTTERAIAVLQDARLDEVFDCGDGCRPCPREGAGLPAAERGRGRRSPPGIIPRAL